MKNKIIEFVENNFEIIKNNFYNSELEILEMMGEDEGEDMSDDIEFLTNQINTHTVEGLIKVINERSLAVDLTKNDELDRLFEDVIKVIIK